MHEATLAASIIEIAEQQASTQPGGPCHISRIGMRLGAFTGVVRESLEFAFEALRPGTLAEHAVLEIVPVPLAAACPRCGWNGQPPQDYCFFCPTCAAPLHILTGREMQVDFIDLEEQPCHAS